MSYLTKIVVAILSAGIVLVNVPQTLAFSPRSVFLQPEDDYPPSDFRLDEPGVYLYRQGTAIPIVASRVGDTPSSAPVRRPQTTSSMPSILIWSESFASNTQLTTFIGGVGLRLSLFNDAIYVSEVIPGLPGSLAGIQNGDILLTIDSSDAPSDEDAAASLLRGAIGSSVELTIVRGTQRQNLTLVRAPLRTETLGSTYSYWDDNTILFQPTEPLVPGIYCLTYGYQWCFDVVAELDPTGYSMPDLSIIPLPNVALRGWLGVGNIMGIVDLGVDSYVDAEISDAWQFYGSEGASISFGIRSYDDNPAPSISLYDDNMTVVPLGRSDFAGIYANLPKSGIYLVVVEANGTGTQYNLHATSY